MVWLVLSAITNAGIYLLFKYYQRWKVDILNVIVVNYTMAACIAFLKVEDYGQIDAAASGVPWITLGVLLGLVFIAIFYLMAHGSQQIGVSITTVASKMSLALSVVLLVAFDPRDTLGPWQWIALVLACAGVVLVSLREEGAHFRRDALLYPLLIFVGSALIDFGIAKLSSYTTNDQEQVLFSGLSFAGAGTAGFMVLAFRRIRGSFHFTATDLLCGLLLGVVNYGTIYFLLLSYDAEIFPRSTTLAINNIAVVLTNAFVSYLLFAERFSRLNLAGLLCALLGIGLLAVMR